MKVVARHEENKPRLYGIYTQDGLVEHFWDEENAKNKIPELKSVHHLLGR